MLIPFLDLSRQHKEVEAEINAALAQTLSSGVYILGPQVEAFERGWAEFCGVSSAAGVAHGTDALGLALIACGAIRPGHRDEVITSPLTAGYTVLPIVAAGGVPVFCDIDAQTLTLDPKAIERAITPRTRAIVPVHLYGQMANMPAICEIAIRHNLFVIEDAAQAHGAELAGKRAGSYGHAAAFSFYPTKNLGAYGDAGAVVSDDAALIERVKTLRQGGHESALRGTVAGQNSRLDELQAAMLCVKLKHLEAWNEQRRVMAQNYHDALRNTSLQIPLAPVREAHVYHLYVVRSSRRAELRAHLAKRGIETIIHYPFLVHRQPLFRQDNSSNRVSVAESAAEQILSLPLYPQLRNEEAQAVIDAVLEFEANA
jgi:dTDP-4-amino-4,6-dideoxygalactose transaminase